jgi:hypothetical protein
MTISKMKTGERKTKNNLVSSMDDEEEFDDGEVEDDSWEDDDGDEY